MNKNFLRKPLLALSLLLSVGLYAQEMPPVQPLPMDPAVRYGKLENGLTYYIRHNEEPKNRCEFHIAQAVGAILEEDNQNGLAHFLEHMAFNGTTHFEGKGIINYFESVGVNFGGDINAYTSLDETVYRLSNVPTTREGIIDSALLVLHDWSCDLSLLPEEIDNERGVIREEWRTGANAMRRMWKESNKQKYPGSQYAKRDVIGDTAIINNFSYQALRDYYHKWYGPDLQAIVVVGDIDVDQIEAKIKALWADVPARANRGERPIYGIDDNVEPIISIVTDKEAPNTRIELEYKKDPLPAEYKLSMVGAAIDWTNTILSTIMGYRFDELTQNPNASFIGAYAGYSELVKSKDAFIMINVAKDGKETDALRDLLIEAERLKRYGVTETEVERAKAEILQSMEQAYNNRNSRKNITLTEECIRHYLDNEFMPGIEWEYEMTKMVFPQINAAMINEAAQQYVTDENLVVSIMAPEKEGINVPNKETILALLDECKKAEIEAPKEEVIDKNLIDKAPKAGKIKSTKQNAELGTTEWTLSNGVKVVIKPTEFKQDEILLNAYSKGGLSQVATADLPSAMFAVDVVENNGLGKFSSVNLRKALTGKSVGITPSIDDYSEGLSGNSSVKDFETLLQLVYLYFTAPRQDDEAFASLKSIYHSSLVNYDANPKSAFNDSIQMTASCHSPRTILVHADILDKVDQATALRIFQERFSNIADFTFFFTGNINPEDKATQEMICQWLGGLKTKKAREERVDNNIRSPKGKVDNYFNREMEIHTASNRIMYTGNMEYNLSNMMNMRIIGDILSTRYLESIREKEGGSYGVGVAGYMERFPENKAVLLMQFDTDPEKQEKLMGIIHQEVMNIVENGPLASDLSKTKEIYLKEFKQNVADNQDWSNIFLPRYYLYGENYLADYEKAVENVTAESIKATLKALVEQGNVMEVVMMPL